MPSRQQCYTPAELREAVRDIAEEPPLTSGLTPEKRSKMTARCPPGTSYNEAWTTLVPMAAPTTRKRLCRASVEMFYALRILEALAEMLLKNCAMLRWMRRVRRGEEEVVDRSGIGRRGTRNRQSLGGGDAFDPAHRASITLLSWARFAFGSML